MKVVRLVSLVLLAVLTVSALSASTSLASTPGFKVLPSGTEFTSTSGTSILKGSTTTITCGSGLFRGITAGIDFFNKAVDTFNSCTVRISGCFSAIRSAGAAVGQIITNKIKGWFGTVKTSKAIGILFEPETAPTNKQFVTFAANECTPESTATGGFIAEVTPINKLQSTSKFVLAATGGEQNITSITVLGKEQEPRLVSFGSDSSITSTGEVTWEGQAEIS